MMLDTLLGNEQLKEALKAALASHHGAAGRDAGEDSQRTYSAGDDFAHVRQAGPQGRLEAGREAGDDSQRTYSAGVHALLLCGPDGCGRGFAARCLAADWLYPNEAGREMVDDYKKTRSPAAAVLSRQSPELLVLEGEGRSGQIPVERVREVRRDVFHTGLSAAGRVVWVRDAQRMAPPAYNALLKILEEPPEGVLFLLTAPSAGQLPATVRSRCAAYTLAPVALDVCERALRERLPPGSDSADARDAYDDFGKGRPADLPALLARLYGGRIGLGLAALRNETRLAILRDALAAARAALAADPLALARQAGPKGQLETGRAGDDALRQSTAAAYGLLRIFSGYEARADEGAKEGLSGREKRDALLFDLSAALAAALRGDYALIDTNEPEGDIAPRCMAAIEAVALAREQLARNASPKITLAALALRLAPAHPNI